ncbi:MAG: type II toxin-antitoxin system mRNA interferase toxin, RelE/StbE family [Candidatus Levyibacteriota bacterium]|nr:MAG: type II toxin-antitoxin system mRNA interferase toxin, RelE/StbE family [Candidatus Levybacteria bacterium]
MKIYYSSRFVKAYKQLPKKIKDEAEKKEKIFRKNPRDIRLKTHKLTGKLKDFWAFSINYQYRILFEFKEKDVIWFHTVGTHEIY